MLHRRMPGRRTKQLKEYNFCIPTPHVRLLSLILRNQILSSKPFLKLGGFFSREKVKQGREKNLWV